MTDLVLLGGLALGLLALWGLRTTHVDEDVTVAVRVPRGQVTVLDPATGDQVSGGGVRSLKPGQEVRAGAGTEAFLFYPDGSISRLAGPGTVVLEESRRSIRKPGPLTGAWARLRGLPPPEPPRVQLVVRVRVVDGEVTTHVVASPDRPPFEVRGPGVVVLAPQASFILTVPGQGDIALEVGEGPVGVGFVAREGTAPVPVVVPRLESKSGITIAATAPGRADAAQADKMLDIVANALPALQQPSASLRVEGITFREVTGAPTYFVGETIDGQPVAAPTQPVQTIAAARVIEEQIKVPGTVQLELSDTDIAAALREMLPESFQSHVLPGGALMLEYGGLSFTARVEIVDGRLEVRGLPLDLDPAILGEGVARALGLEELPPLLSLVSEHGTAAVTYTTDTVATTTTTVAEEPPPVPASLPRTDPYFRSIPTPREVSTDWKVVGSNALLAAGLTLLIRVFAGFGTSFVRQQEDRLVRLYAPLAAAAGAIARPVRRIGHVLRWVAPGPLTGAFLMMFLFGAIYSFLATGSGLLGPGGVTVLITLSFTTGFLALYDMRVRTVAARRMKVGATSGVFPGQVGVAVVTVTFSRVFSFVPGLLLGSPAGAKLPKQGVTARHKLVLNLVSLGFLAGLGAVAWAVAYSLPLVAAQPWARSFFQVAKGLTSGLQDWSLVMFAMAVQRVFFPLLPLPGSVGQDLLKRNILVWAAILVPVLFIFLHTQVNQKKAVTDLSAKTYITLAVVAALAALALAYQGYQSRQKRRAAPAAATPPSPSAQAR